MDHIVKLKDQSGNIVTTLDLTNIEMANLQRANNEWHVAVWHADKQALILALRTPDQETAKAALEEITKGLERKK